MKIRALILAVTAALSVTGCTSTQLANFQSGVANVQAGIVSVNQAIGAVSPKLLENCNSLQTFANLLAPLAAGKYNADYQAAVATLDTYCTAPPVSNVVGVVSLTATAYANAKAAYNAAKKTGG